MSGDFKSIVLQPEDGSLDPPTTLELFPFGLVLNRFYISDGKTHDILVGPYDIQDYKNSRRFQNPIVGRYCNRIPAGEQRIAKDGIEAVINPISTESPTVSLHGGPVGFDHVVWKPQANLSDAKLFTPAELASIEAETKSSALFSYTSPEGTEGFPGTLDVEVVWMLTNPSPTFDPQTYERQLGSVVLIYRAQVRNGPEGDGTKIVTPINLTQHWGFNLDASCTVPEGPTPDVKAHKLYINANKILEGDNVLPTGKLIDIKGTRFDFTELDTTIGSRYEGGYDHFYLFPPSARQASHVAISGLKSGSQNLIPAIFQKGEPRARLSSDNSGIRLAFHTNQRGVQLYTGTGLDGSGGRKKIHGGSKTGLGYEAGAAAFLEFHAPHAAYLHPFKQDADEEALLGDDTLLTSDELYHHWVRVDISQVLNRQE